MSSTTIKVPTALRDRLAARASAQKVTLAGAIEQALDASDEQRFWDAVRAEHAEIGADEREAYSRSTDADDLADPDDDEITRRDAW